MSVIIRTFCSAKPLRRFFSHYHLATCSPSQYVEVPSALHLLFEHKKAVFQSVAPFLEDFDYFRDIDLLHSDLKKRGLDITKDRLLSLREECQMHCSVSRALLERKTERNSLCERIKLPNNDDAECTRLKLQLSGCIEEIRKKQEILNDLEKSFILPYLNLPNSLHESTGEESEELAAYFSKPTFNFSAKSHMILGELRREILHGNVSPNSFYLAGPLAALEFAAGNFIFTEAKKFGFTPLSVTDIGKAVLIEGCGFDTEDFFEIYNRDCVSSSLKDYLVGGASLPCCIALYSKLLKNPNFTQPLRTVSVGRKYKRITSTRADLYNTPQCTSACGVVTYSCYREEEPNVLNEVSDLVTKIYSELGLHFQLVKYGASKLTKYESLAVGVVMFSPFDKEYIEVGRISVCGNYLSKRLQCIEGLGRKKGAFLGVIFVEIMNVTKWIACMMENTQSIDGNYAIPKCLKGYMFDMKCQYL